MTEREAFETAFQRIVDEHSASLHRYLGRLSGDSDFAKDLTQEAFVRLYERGAIPDDPRAWLAAVASNLFRDDRRRVKRRLNLLAREPSDITLGSPGAAPDDYVIERERQTCVRVALDQLPLRDRQMLLLRHEGYSYREIAQAVGVAETGVGTLLIRATEAFRTEFMRRNSASD